MTAMPTENPVSDPATRMDDNRRRQPERATGQRGGKKKMWRRLSRRSMVQRSPEYRYRSPRSAHVRSLASIISRGEALSRYVAKGSTRPVGLDVDSELRVDRGERRPAGCSEMEAACQRPSEVVETNCLARSGVVARC